jgi:hypothetical protein
MKTISLTHAEVSALLNAIDSYEDAVAGLTCEKEDGLIPGNQLPSATARDLKRLKSVVTKLTCSKTLPSQ